MKKYRKRENELLSKLAHYQRPQVHESHSSASLDAAVETAQTSAQQELESLPNHVLRQARVVHDHMHYFVNKSHMIERDGKAMYIPEELKELLDEISQLEDIGGRAKRDILEDNESRNVRIRALCAVQSADSAVLPVSRHYSCSACNVSRFYPEVRLVLTPMQEHYEPSSHLRSGRCQRWKSATTSRRHSALRGHAHRSRRALSPNPHGRSLPLPLYTLHNHSPP